MKIPLFLKDTEEKIVDLNTAIDICKDNQIVQKTLKDLLEYMIFAYDFVYQIKDKLLPCLQNDTDVVKAYLFKSAYNDNDYIIDIIIQNPNNINNEDYRDCIKGFFRDKTEKEDILFGEINIYFQDEYVVESLNDYDYLELK